MRQCPKDGFETRATGIRPPLREQVRQSIGVSLDMRGRRDAWQRGDQSAQTTRTLDFLPQGGIRIQPGLQSLVVLSRDLAIHQRDD